MVGLSVSSSINRLEEVTHPYLTRLWTDHLRENEQLWGFPQIGDTTIAGWFIAWKIHEHLLYKWMRTGGTPIGNHHMTTWVNLCPTPSCPGTGWRLESQVIESHSVAERATWGWCQWGTTNNHYERPVLTFYYWGSPWVGSLNHNVDK